MTVDPGHAPDWGINGLLPPFAVSPTSKVHRSPYLLGITDLVLRFGNTIDRRRLLRGLLDYRSALHNSGIRNGFQWINGSFVEDKMRLSRRDPKDIDVVTFFHLPSGITQIQFAHTNRHLFDHDTTRTTYGVDAYSVTFGDGDQSHFHYIARSVAYWNSLWSHSRTGQWKGYLELILSSSEDATARALLHESAPRQVD